MALPEGWTLERVREEAQAEDAELVAIDRPVFLMAEGAGDRECIDPVVILHVGGLYLVLPRGKNDDWLMGSDDDGGAVLCWAYYGSLGDALRAL